MFFQLCIYILKVGMSEPAIPGLRRLRSPINMISYCIVRNPLRQRETKRSPFLECGEEIVDSGIAGVELSRNLTPESSSP